MFQSQRLRFEPQVVVDYQSPHGPRVTDIRGIVIQGRLNQLRENGHYDDYLARLPSSHKDLILHALASSWVPIETSLVHFDTLDAMPLSDQQITRMAEPMGAGIFHNLFASMVRAARSNGAEAGVWLGLRQADRVFGRMYNGGCCKVTQVGPKDAIIEVDGLSFARSRCFRLSHCAFLRGVFSFSTKACVCKPLPQRDASRERLAVSLSWV
jgi:hypothetical protein